MEVEKIPIVELDVLSKLMSEYIEGNSTVKHLYKYEKEIASFRAVIKDKISQNIDRKTLSNELEKQYLNIQNKEKVSHNIELLKDEKTFTITTAHQLCLLTGPLYFIYKIISTIKLCLILKSEYPDCNFVPIFWLGSEDHDFQEINHLHFPNKKIEWESGQNGAVGRMENRNLENVFLEINDYFNNSNKNDMLNIMQSLFSKNSNYSFSFIKFIHHLFGGYGLVVLEQDNFEYKKIFANVISEELLNNIVKNNIQKELNFINNNYKIQAKPRDINLFYLKNNIRERIVRKGDVFHVNNTKIEFDEKSILSELKNHPDRFSPNVLLRPLYQEFILPNLAYIGGAGELSYWLQLKTLFETQAINFPMLLLRDMGLIIDAKTNKKIAKISFDKKSLFLDKELLISNLILKTSSKNLSLQKEIDEIEYLYKSILKKAINIDKSLEGNILSEEKKSLKSIQNIEGKMLRAEKRNNELVVNQISGIKEKLFPNGNLQERVMNFLPYFLKYEKDFFEKLLEEFNPLEASIKIFTEEE